MEEIMSQVEGINSNEQVEADSQETTKTSKSNVPKLLAEKNAAIKRAEEAEAKLSAWLDMDALTSKVIEQMKAKERQEVLIKEKNVFLEQFGEESLEKVEAIRTEHQSLSYQQAAKLAWIEGMSQTNPSRLSFSWTTPSEMRSKKSFSDLDPAVQKEQANEMLKQMFA